MTKTIKVTGKANLKIHPDITVLSISFEGEDKNYNSCVSRSTYDLNALTLELKKHGFKREEIKTSYFSINEVAEHYKDESGRYITKYTGFKYFQSVKIEFPNNNELLGNIIDSLTRLDTHPTFKINYIVGDSEKYKNEIISLAVRDAMAKALILANSASVILKEIIDINYSWDEIELSTRQFEVCHSLSMSESCGCDIDIEPDDVNLSDSVTVVYSIE